MVVDHDLRLSDLHSGVLAIHEHQKDLATALVVGPAAAAFLLLKRYDSDMICYLKITRKGQKLSLLEKKGKLITNQLSMKMY